MKTLDLTPRTVHLNFRGTSIDGSITPADFPQPLLAAELADEYLGMFLTLGLSHGTMYNHRKALLSLLNALPVSLKKSSSLETDDAAVVDAFYQWEVELGEKYRPTSHLPAEFPTVIRRLVRRRLDSGKPTSAHAQRWALGSNLHQGGIDQPLDEFSNAERLGIRDGCRQRIRAMEQRLERGRRLLEAGRDPRVHGWSSLPNMIWGTHHLAKEGIPSFLNDMSQSFDALSESEQGELGGPHPHGKGRSFHIVRNLMSLLYPTALDLNAYRALLQLETGAAPEEITDIKPSELQWHDGSIHAPLHKNRAHRTRRTKLKTSGDNAQVREGWRGGDLVHGLLGAMRLTQELPGKDIDSLFPVARRTGSVITKNREHFQSVNFSSLVSALPASISRPYDPRRLRKTVKTARAAVLQSAAAAAGDDHTIAIFQRHYAQSTTVHILAANAVTTAQQQVFERATDGPTFIPVQAIVALSGGLPPDIRAAASKVAAEEEVDAGMTVAQCSDPYSSPYGNENELCQVRPTMCFACPNAIVFSDHLPRLIAYRGILETHQREMPPTVFAAGHGQQLRNLDRILGEFPAEEIAQANTALESSLPKIHIPLSQRGTHL